MVQEFNKHHLTNDYNFCYIQASYPRAIVIVTSGPAFNISHLKLHSHVGMKCLFYCADLQCHVCGCMGIHNGRSLYGPDSGLVCGPEGVESSLYPNGTTALLDFCLFGAWILHRYLCNAAPSRFTGWLAVSGTKIIPSLHDTQNERIHPMKYFDSHTLSGRLSIFCNSGWTKGKMKALLLTLTRYSKAPILKSIAAADVNVQQTKIPCILLESQEMRH